MSITQIDAKPRPGHRHRRVRRSVGAGEVARFAGSVLAWLALLGAVTMLAAAVLVPRIGGATPYTVLTGSMEPTYPPGTLIVARPVEAGSIGVGTVITFQLASGQPTVATHRVVAIARHPDGDVRFQTKGDANDAIDPRWVRPEQVRGALWYAVPYLGSVSQLLSGEQRQWGVLAVAVVLLGYAGAMFVGAARARLRARRAA
jgi:signal peptidase I